MAKRKLKEVADDQVETEDSRQDPDYEAPSAKAMKFESDTTAKGGTSSTMTDLSHLENYLESPNVKIRFIDTEGNLTRQWTIHKNLLTHKSEYFKIALLGKPPFREQTDLEFTFKESDHDVNAFELIAKWFYEGKPSLIRSILPSALKSAAQTEGLNIRSLHQAHLDFVKVYRQGHKLLMTELMTDIVTSMPRVFKGVKPSITAYTHLRKNFTGASPLEQSFASHLTEQICCHPSIATPDSEADADWSEWTNQVLELLKSSGRLSVKVITALCMKLEEANEKVERQDRAISELQTNTRTRGKR